MKEIAVKAALQGGKVLMKFFSEKFSVISKSERDIVTTVDTESERTILKVLQKSFPKHNFVSEEIGKIDNGSDYTWIIDPLDGTVNFAAHNPLFAISIALKKKKEIALSVIYLPIFDEMFVAEKSRGAILNNKPISVSSKNELKKAISSVSPGIKTEEKVQAMKKIIGAVMPKSRSILVLGSTPTMLAFVACGRVDNYITYKSDVYNMAAGYLLIKEAGGKVTDFKNNEFNIDSEKLNVIASNGFLHKEIMPIINKLNL